MSSHENSTENVPNLSDLKSWLVVDHWGIELVHVHETDAD